MTLVLPTPAWAADGPLTDGPSLKQTGSADFKNYTDLSILGVSDDGSVAVVSASNQGTEVSKYFMVTTKDVSLTEIASEKADSDKSYSVMVSQDGKYVYFYDSVDKQVNMIDVATKKTTVLPGLTLEDGWYLSWADHDRLIIYEGTDDNAAVAVYDVKQQRLLPSVDLSDIFGYVTDSTLSHVYTIEASSGSSSGTLHTYDLTTGQKTDSKSVSFPSGINFDTVGPYWFMPDGKTMLVVFYTSDYDAIYARLDTKTGKMSYLSDKPTAVGVIGGNRYALVYEGKSGGPSEPLRYSDVSDLSSVGIYDTVAGRMIWNVNDSSLMKMLAWEGGVSSVSLSEDGRYAFAGSSGDSDGRVEVIDMKTGTKSTVATPDKNRQYLGSSAVSLSHDSSTLLIATVPTSEGYADGDNAAKLLIYDTGIGGNPWSRPKAWIMVGVGAGAAVILLVVIVLLVVRARRRRRRQVAAGGVAGVGVGSGISAFGAGVPAMPGASGMPGVPGMPNAPNMPNAPSAPGVPGASGVSGTMPPASSGVAIPLPTMAQSGQRPVQVPGGAQAGQSRPKFCTSCGAALGDASVKFCPQCGRRVA
ncbi:zinc-ribbon domain-containing protein [Bifidobacterium olomucense]|nr:zinc-ribbon domain-containing protein [Bifidobacterium sp. DSM 109959]